MVSVVEHLFHAPVVRLYVSFGKMSIRVFCSFFKLGYLWVFFYLVVWNSCIFCINPLADTGLSCFWWEDMWAVFNFLYVPFFLATFKIFSLPLFFNSLTKMYFFFVFVLLGGILGFLDLLVCIFHQVWGKFWLLFLQKNFFCPIVSSYLFCVSSHLCYTSWQLFLGLLRLG